MTNKQEWAHALKRDTRKDALNVNMPVTTQRKHISDELVENKKRLLLAIGKGDKGEIDNILDTLIKLRGKQAHLRVQEHVATQRSHVSINTIKHHLRQYTRDCMKLIHAVHRV
jgi:hydroxyethylthiazole kinase-like sugar kinase family protein